VSLGTKVIRERSEQMSYDYKDGKQRIENILNKATMVRDGNDIPGDSYFTFDNGVLGWVTAVFIDIRKSTELFQNENKTVVARIIRSFTSECIEILSGNGNQREIGIRGDCVYAIYSTPQQHDINGIMNLVAQINTLIKMLNKLFEEKSFQTISVGIGVSAAKELVVKAGRKGSGINNKVWIGSAVTEASKLSGYGNTGSVFNLINPIVVSNVVYINIIEVDKEWDEKNLLSLVTIDGKHCYHGDFINTDFNEWIERGMKI